MFHQILDPTGNLFLTWLIALVPVALLLFLLAVLRMSAWLAVLIGSIVTYVIAVFVWHMPANNGALAYLYGSATGVWSVDWITIWGVMLFNTLVVTGVFERFRRRKARPMCGYRRCCSPGPSGRFSKGWWASATLGPLSRRS
jgi:lactate permease